MWKEWLFSYWRDPRNVFNGARLDEGVRRLFKVAWFAVAMWVLFEVAGPTNVNSLKLWLEDDELAAKTAWGMTWASALAFLVVREASRSLEPMRIAFPFVRWRLVLPSMTVLLGSVLVVGLLYVQLIGQWNYYLHDQMKTGGVAAAALDSGSDRVGEAERALAQFETRSQASLAIIDRAIAETSAGSPTGRSRLVRERAQTEQAQARERQALQDELRQARAANVETRQDVSDVRPVDGQLAGVFGLPRDVMASINDLQRSGLIELLLVLGAALSMVGATSSIFKPAAEPSPASAPEHEDAPAPIIESPAPERAGPQVVRIKPRKRFLLPSAAPEDRKAA